MKIYFDDTLINEDYYIAINNDYSLFKDNFILGSTASNVFRISLDKRAVSFAPSKVILKDSNDNCLAVLKVDNVDDTDDFMYSYTLTDSMIDLDFNYDASAIIEESETGSVSLLDILSDICNKAGIGLNVSSLSNDIEVSWYDNTITARQYVGYIAELQGGYAFINEHGNLDISKHKQESKKTISYDEIKDSKLGEYHKITRVVYDNGVNKCEYGDETYNTLYISSSNPFITNTEVVSKIYKEISGFEFYSFKTSDCPIDFGVKAGNIITFTDGTNNYPTIAQYSISYNSGWSGGYSLEVATKRQEETKALGNNDKIKKIETELNRTNASLNIVAQQSEETTKQVAQMKIETDNILLNVSSLDTQVNNNYQEIKEKFNDYTPVSKTVEIERNVEKIQTDTYTKTEVNTKLTDGSVTKVQTTAGTFDEDGMHYEKTGARTSSTINQSGVSVNDTQNNEELLFAGYDDEIKESIVRTENLTVRKYFVCGNYARFEDYTDEDGNTGIGVFLL